MVNSNPWILPDSSGTVQNTFRVDPLYKQAVQELADRESELYGVKISMITIMVNLSTRDTIQMRNNRSRLNKRYNQLKEHTHGKRKYFDIKDGK